MKTNRSIRLRTEPGSSENITVKIEQEFDTIDFLSLKITQDEAYRNFCSDYGVIAGRVIANDGFGVENAKISVFIPLSNEDAEDSVISSLYPYLTPTDTNAQGVRYNLLPEIGKVFEITIKVPYTDSGLQQPPDQYYYNENWSSLGIISDPWEFVSTNPAEGYSIWKNNVTSTTGPDVSVGTFPSKTKVLNNDSLLEVHKKYYKYTTRTNASGDYMIFGVPIGVKTVHMDVDLSDTGSASLTVNDFTGLGFPPTLFDGNNFKTSTNLDELVQIETQNLSVDVIPFWGNTEQCEIGISRLDFKLTKEIKPSALLFFQTFTNENGLAIRELCNGIDGASNNSKFRDIGRMQQLAVTVGAISSGGDFIDTQNFNDGNVFYALPMFEDRFITNESGSLVPSPDPNKGVPTGGSYRVFVYAQSNNIQDLSNQEGHATAIIGNGNFDTIKYRYDLQNRKQLVYTVGQRNESNENNTDNGKHMMIAGNQTNNVSGRKSYPGVNIQGGEQRWSRIDGALNKAAPICYGSLYMPRLKIKNENWCGKSFGNTGVAGVYTQTLDPVPLSSGILVYATGHMGSYGVLDVTDILPLFSEFGGGFLNSTSANNNAGFNGPTSPTSSDLDLYNQAFPLSSTEYDSTSGGYTLEFPKRLNKIDDSVERVRCTDLNQGNPSFNAGETGEKAIVGWYFFYFGLQNNDTSLTKAKNKIN